MVIELMDDVTSLLDENTAILMWLCLTRTRIKKRIMFVNSFIYLRFYIKHYLFLTRSAPIGVIRWQSNHQNLDFSTGTRTILRIWKTRSSL
jgi:hypothetical protein